MKPSDRETGCYLVLSTKVTPNGTTSVHVAEKGFVSKQDADKWTEVWQPLFTKCGARLSVEPVC